jgi:hypothetical protein
MGPFGHAPALLHTTFSDIQPVKVQGVTGSPDVFQYAVADIDGGPVYSMRFYKAFLVFGFRAVEVDAVGTQPE